MIQRLQSLFNVLVGVHEAEAMLRRQAHQVFGQPPAWSAEMEIPACYRRKPSVRLSNSLTRSRMSPGATHSRCSAV